jgi:hypothetical protein
MNFGLVITVSIPKPGSGARDDNSKGGRQNEMIHACARSTGLQWLFRRLRKPAYTGSSITTTWRSSAGAPMGTMVSMSVWTLSHC